jgi:hypothetical protein
MNCTKGAGRKDEKQFKDSSDDALNIQTTQQEQ